MNAVLGVSRLLADTHLSFEQQQYVTMIDTSGSLLLTIIDDILDFSEIEAGHLQLQLESHNLVDVVESVMMLCYDMAASKGLEASWYIDPSIVPSLMLDGMRLQQVILNLLSNAIKFTKAGGVDLSVDLRVATASSADASGDDIHQTGASSASHSRHYVSFRIMDTGIGISEEQIDMLFQSFTQVQHMSGEYGGTGLGLVISKRLVEGMGGQLTVESEVGVGSTFSFMIPVEHGHRCRADDARSV